MVRKAAARFVMGEADCETRLQLGFQSHRGLLVSLRANGFQPRTVVDIGANRGAWSLAAFSVFPNARYYLFEANESYVPDLEAACRRIGNAEPLVALLGASNREEVEFYLMGDGSSVYPEVTSFKRNVAELPMTRLDDCLPAPPAQPVILKLDVQGFELEVLRGGRATLALAEVVILETSLITYNEGSPLLADVVAFMKVEGFVPFDVFGPKRRETDRILFQVDVAFARESSALRARKAFWRDEPLPPRD